MNEHILKRHNKTLISYHIVCPTKYRRKVFTKKVELSLKNIFFEIEERYEIHFVEIGADEDHVHFLVQSIPVISPSKVVQIINSITAKKIRTSPRDQEIALRW
jgi:putative transposase